jgi:hypothetical protein
VTRRAFTSNPAVRLAGPLAIIVTVAASSILIARSPERAAAQAILTRESAYRANNIGVTRLEQFDFPAAAIAFRQALALDATLALARLNLGIALFYSNQTSEAAREIAAAKPGLAGVAQPDYMLGLIARGLDQPAEAIAVFTRVQQIDPGDPGTAINIGQIHLQERRYGEAIAAFRIALASEPYNATATYGLATALLRSGSADEGQKTMERFQGLQDAGYAVTYAQTYLEQGRYAEAIASTGAEPELVDTRVPDVEFVDGGSMMTPSATAPPPAAVDGRVSLFDLDADGDLDLADAGAAGLRLWRNDAGRLVDVTAALLGPAATAPAIGVVAGDYDNDNDNDLAVLTPAGLRLLRRDAAAFTDVTAAAGVSAPRESASAAWLDADHDGDLDLLLASPTPQTASATLLWRNNGNGTFADTTVAAGVAVTAGVVALVPTDFDNRRDIDILALRSSSGPALYRNLREGAFRDVAVEVGLSGTGAVPDATIAAIGDVNKDGYPDFFFGDRRTAGTFAMSDGRGHFTPSAAPSNTTGATAAQFIDYDNDGLLDLVLLATGGPQVLRNVGRGWTNVTSRAVPPAMASALAGAQSLAAADLDGDGDTDVVSHGRAGVVVWRNEGGSRARSIRPRLRPLVSNRSAAGAKVEMRAGSLRQLSEVYAATPAPAPSDLLFGLGDRPGADVVRVRWPSGILQAETGSDPINTATPPTPLTGVLAIEELNRKPSSCPFLFTWNGTRFEFITDFMGGGEMGYWEGPNQRNIPDPDEYVRIDGSQLRSRNGRYEIRVTNELEEVMYLDRLQLVVVSHPGGVEVHPNEGLTTTPIPFTLYTASQLRPPVAARDDSGKDVLDRVRAVDRAFVDTLPLAKQRGYAEPHNLTLTLPAAGPSGRRLLLLTGWTDYAFSDDNAAALQAGLPTMLPALQVKGPDGSWRTVIEDIGFPVGRPQTMVVDLSTKVPASATEVRIRTSLRIYWDRVLVDTSDGKTPYTLDRLEATDAHLRWRGYSAEAPPDGREPITYDYTRTSKHAPWKLMPGRYTREGDVRPLLTKTDDMFVVSRTGDEIALAFDATSLPALPSGWTRTFLLYADGFSKEMNLYSSSPDELNPLPFHGMTKYPYAAPESYPLTPQRREYLETYNTRIVPRAQPPLELAGRAR